MVASEPVSSPPQSRYRPEIDGLRALAIAAVIINHVNKAILPSGYLGVDVFFVISGFVITASLASRPSHTFGDFLSGFYTRRIKRLVPALLFFVAVSSLLISLFDPSPEASLTTGLYSLFGLSNLYLLNQAVDYFATSTELNIFTHTWSLGVEEQFYLLFPFLVWFTGFSRSAKNGARNLFWVIGALSVASVVGFVHLYPTNQPAAYFLMPARLWEVGVGCLLFLSLQKFRRLGYALARIPPLVIVAGMVSLFFVSLELAVVATIGMVLLTVVLLVCLRPGTAAYAIFTHSRVVYIGILSYSLYLWHWGVISISRWTIGIHWWSLPIQIALILVLSIGSYRYIETPLRRSDWSSLRWKTIGYGLLASACVAGLLVTLKQPSVSLYTGQTPSLIATGAVSLREPYSPDAVDSQWEGDDCVLSDNAEVGSTISVEDCTLGNFAKAKKRVLILGNSFSVTFTQAFDKLVVSDGYAVTITSSWGASPVKEVSNDTQYKKANDYYWQSVAPTLIDRLSPGDWVFLISDMSDFSPKKPSPRNDSRLEMLETGLRNLSNALSEDGMRLAVLHGLPFAREANCQPAVAAEQWFSPFGGPCKLPDREQTLSRRAALDKILTALESEGKLRVIDLLDIFCPEARCTYNAASGQILYRDEFSHPSVEAARIAAPTIRDVLTSS